MRVRSGIAATALAAALAASAVTVTGAPARATPDPPSTAAVKWRWFAVFDPASRPDGRTGVELATCVDGPDAATGEYVLVFEAVPPDGSPPAGTCSTLALPGKPPSSTAGPVPPTGGPATRTARWEPEADQVGGIASADVLNAGRAVLGVCDDGTSVLGVQVDVRQILAGKEITPLKPGDDEDTGRAPAGCAKGGVVDGEQTDGEVAVPDVRR